jgi:hypothetical protein
MDGPTCHESEVAEDLCLENECFIQILPPHSRGKVQLCDVGIFGARKADNDRVRAAADLSKHSNQVRKILGRIQTTFLPLTVIHVFAQGRIPSQYYEGHACLMCPGSSSSARCVRSWRVPSGMEDRSATFTSRCRRLPIA